MRNAIPIASKLYVRDAISIAPKLYMRSQSHEAQHPTDGQTTEPFFLDVFMHPPNDCFFFSGCSYHSYPRRDDCTFFFQVVIMNSPKHPSSCQGHNRISPTNSQTTVRFFFQVVIMNPPKHTSSWNPLKHSHWRPDDWAFFSEHNFEPARQLDLFFQVIIISPTKGQTTPRFIFSGCNFEPAKTSKLVEPPQPFPLTARRLSLFFRT